MFERCFRYLKCPQIDVEMFLKEWFLLNRNCLRRQPVCLQLIITPFCLDHEFCSWQEAQSMEDMRHALCGSVGGLVIPRRDPHSGLRCWEGWQGWWFWPEIWCFLSQDGWIYVFFWSRMHFRQLFCGVSTSPYVAFMLGKPLRTLLALPKNMEPMTMTTTEKNQGELAIYLAAGVGHRMGGRLKDHWAAQSSEARPCGGWCGSLCSCLAAWAFSILRRILRCWYLLIFGRPPWNHEKLANEHYLRVTPSESQDWSCWSIRGWHWVCVVWLSVFYQGEELRGNQTKYPQRIPEVRLGPLVSASYELAYKPH